MTTITRPSSPPVARQMEQFSRGAVFKWLLMAFMAGSINAGGFLACERFVTHVTGFATFFGLNLASGRWLPALEMLSVPVFFLMGCVISALFTDARVQQGKKPHYGTVMGIVSVILTLVAAGGYLGQLGTFGEVYSLEGDYLLLALLCLASGLQNAAVTSASGAVMRTTHLTGLTTDLGIGIVRAFFGYGNRDLRKREFYRTWMRLAVIVAFALGGLGGALMFMNVDYLGFFLPAILAAYCGLLSLRGVMTERRGEAPSGYSSTAKAPMSVVSEVSLS